MSDEPQDPNSDSDPSEAAQASEDPPPAEESSEATSEAEASEDTDSKAEAADTASKAEAADTASEGETPADMASEGETPADTASEGEQALEGDGDLELARGESALCARLRTALREARRRARTLQAENLALQEELFNAGEMIEVLALDLERQGLVQ